jgi:hypothetical protein
MMRKLLHSQESYSNWFQIRIEFQEISIFKVKLKRDRLDHLVEDIYKSCPHLTPL